MKDLKYFDSLVDNIHRKRRRTYAGTLNAYNFNLLLKRHPEVQCEKQLVASQERHRVDQDPNNDCAHVRQKNDLIITLPTGPALEGFICEVSGRLPAGCPKKIWIDKLKPMEKKGQISGVMDVQEYGIYCFGIINKVFLPASMQELSAYESVYVIAFLRDLKVKCTSVSQDL
ncbi:13470_t:CDS:2 [Entrophospora sp. SA101]|nr:13470_t:CDS:2 [Entrophospora sp. SA101]